MNYYQNQLQKIELSKDYAPTIQVTDHKGNKTNCVNLNAESAAYLISWLNANFVQPNKVKWTKVNRDVNGNPRYVCHFTNFANDYPTALKIAKELGGRKYNNKTFGGGVVFQSYNVDNLTKKILEIRNK